MHAFLDSISKHVHPQKIPAWNKACALEIPFENYQYVPLKQLYEKKWETASEKEISFQDIESGIFSECKNSVLVFVDGIYSERLSRTQDLPSSFLAMPMTDAEVQFDTFLKGRYERLLRDEKDPMPLFNYATSIEGVFLYLSAKTHVKVPIQILNVYRHNASLCSPRIVLCLGKESFCNIYTNELYLDAQDNHSWINSSLDVVLEERANLTLSTLFSKAKYCVHTESVRVQLKKESTLKVLTFGTGKQILRQDFAVTAFKNSHATLTGAFVLDQKLETHIHTLVEHKEESAYSLQKFKGILNGQSKMSFTGKIHVDQQAQQTQAYQINNNLILSDLARCYSKPNLEIFADDVKASHGATIGRLNHEELFYMKTRGFSEKMATKLLVEGFYREVLQQIPLVSAKNYAQLSL